MAKKPAKKKIVKKKAPTKKTTATKKAPAKKKAAKKPPPRSGGCLNSCFTVMAVFMVIIIVALLTVSAATISLISKYTKELPNLEAVNIPAPKEKTKVYASGGQVIAELYFENREFAHSQEIPDIVKLAFIAIEDERFYKHRGVDVEGLVRIVFLALKTRGRTLQGASTITQQLARHIYLKEYRREGSGRYEMTVIRKIKEGILAIALEKKYAKDEILAHYLNLISYGHGAYGIKTAAKTFFGKNLGELTLDEAALLAAVINAPSRYSPYYNPTNAINRRNLVLQKMRELHFISPGEFETASSRPLDLAELSGPAHENYKAPYFVTYVIDRLEDDDFDFPIDSKSLFSDGYRIYTTLDLKTNRIAEEAIDFGMKLAAERKANVKQSAIVAIQPQTGRIISMVGGTDFKKSKFNRAWQALRQPGSAFKPFVYITAVRQGYSMESTLLDEKVCYDAYPEEYCPNNYDHKYQGLVTFHTAMKLSRNIPAVKVGHLVRPENIIKTARDMGIKSPLSPNLSLPLGTSEVTILEMASAYSVLANGGRYVEPVAIERIEDSSGFVLYEKKYRAGRKILEDNTVSRIVPVMQDVIRSGTGTRARIKSKNGVRPAAGKTGTTSDFRDAWFVGFTPDLVAAVWFGNDDNSPMRNMYKGRPVGRGVTGGAIPAPTWGFFMKKALAGRPIRDFKLPPWSPMKTYQVEVPEATETELMKSPLSGAEGRNYNFLEPDAADFGNQSEDERRIRKPAHKTRRREMELEFVEPEKQEREPSDIEEFF